MTKREKKHKQTGVAQRSPCPVAGTLDILGDKWTLLVVRDLFFGDKTYGEFLRAPEGIPTNILAERLKRLEQAGIVSRQAYQQRPVRYRYSLTAKGRDLSPVMMSIVKWANVHLPDTYSLEEVKAIIKQQSGQK